MKILFDRIDEPGLNTLEVYERRGGYQSLRKALEHAARGGAPADHRTRASAAAAAPASGWARRPRFLPHGDMDKYLVCNADESEPGTFKDRELMQKSPHMLIEGILIASWAAEISRAFIYIRGEYDHQADILEAAIAEARDAGYIGEKILGSDHTISLVLHRGAGAYICGEETGLLDSLEGKRGNPRLKPPFPAIEGLYHGPTLINNVETLATVPHIIRMGGEEYASIGTETSTGTKLVSVSGDVQRPGNYEIVLGTPCREIIYGLAGGPFPGREVKFWFPGGSSSPVLTRRRPRPALRLRLDGQGRHRCSARARSSSSTTRTPCSRSASSWSSSTRTSRAASACRAGRAPAGRCRMVERIQSRRGHPDGSRHHGLRAGADHRQLPVRARRRDGDAGRVDGREVPRRSSKRRSRPRASAPRGRSWLE